MKIGILGALDIEVALLVEHMQVECETKLMGTTFYSGTLAGCPVVVAVMSIGKVNAALCTSLMVREFGAQAIINVGIAGAIADGLGVMDVVVSNDVVFHDAEPLMSKYYPFKLKFEADKVLAEMALDACNEVMSGKGHMFKMGLIATGDQFVSSSEQRESIKQRFYPLCVEMEGAAVAHAAYVNGAPFVVIRTMSDSADDNAGTTYDNFSERAAYQSASIVMAMAKRAAINFN